jgi:hypothetical protein
MLNPSRPPPPTRDTVVRLALQEVGKPDAETIRGYHSGALGRAHVGKQLEWCGLFCLHMLHEAGLAKSVFWRLGGGFCEEQRLQRVKLPEPGDVIYYHTPFQHHALVHSVDLDAGTFSSIDGNQAGDTVVLRTGIPLTKPTCFYSIEKFLTADTDPPDTEPEPEVA